MSLHTALRPNRGFHGSLISNITLSHSHRRPECTLHILYVLPPIAFIDPYELELRSDQYTYHYEGTRNLELPIVAVDRDKPGVLLVDVNDVTKKGGNGHLEVEVPLHFRYGVPLEECESSKEAVERGSLEQPWGFITCPLSDQSPVLEKPPIPIPYALPPSWTFLQSKDIEPLEATEGAGSLDYAIPLGRKSDLLQVEIGTALVFLLCFLYLLRVTLRAVQRMREKSASRECKKQR